MAHDFQLISSGEVNRVYLHSKSRQKWYFGQHQFRCYRDFCWDYIFYVILFMQTTEFTTILRVLNFVKLCSNLIVMSNGWGILTSLFTFQDGYSYRFNMQCCLSPVVDYGSHKYSFFLSGMYQFQNFEFIVLHNLIRSENSTKYYRNAKKFHKIT